MIELFGNILMYATLIVGLFTYILWSIQSVCEIVKCISYKCIPREGAWVWGLATITAITVLVYYMR